MCGSCHEGSHLAALMDGAAADVVWTDPPRNVERRRRRAALGAEEDEGGLMSRDRFRAFLREALAACRPFIRSGSSLYIAHDDAFGLEVREAVSAAELRAAGCLIWRRSGPHGAGDYRPDHEPILYAQKEGAGRRWYGGRKKRTFVSGFGAPFEQLEDGRWVVRLGEEILVVDGAATVEAEPSSVFFEGEAASEDDGGREAPPRTHPVALIERMLRNSARAGDVMLDPFAGAGSTLMAAERLQMRARVIGASPKGVDAVVRRWQNYTGRRAEHASGGAPFPAPPATLK